MPRSVKWSRDLHPLRERAQRARTETWSRQDIERLFGVSRPSAQNLMKAIGEVRMVGAAHFVDRTSLLKFLDEMIAAPTVEEALRNRLENAAPAPRPKALHITLPKNLCHVMLPDLPECVKLSPGRIEITSNSAEGLAESLMVLAMIMQNDLDRWTQAVSQEPAQVSAGELASWIALGRSVPEGGHV